MTPRTERQMVEHAEVELRRDATPYALEVPFLDRSIDLVYEQGAGYVTIEFKRKDWRRAIRQARDHQLGAKGSYICLPKDRVTDEVILEAKEAGIGILVWTPECPMDAILCPEPPADFPSSIGASWLEEAFRARINPHNKS